MWVAGAQVLRQSAAPFCQATRKELHEKCSIQASNYFKYGMPASEAETLPEMLQCWPLHIFNPKRKGRLRCWNRSSWDFRVRDWDSWSTRDKDLQILWLQRLWNCLSEMFPILYVICSLPMGSDRVYSSLLLWVVWAFGYRQSRYTQF